MDYERMVLAALGPLGLSVLNPFENEQKNFTLASILQQKSILKSWLVSKFWRKHIRKSCIVVGWWWLVRCVFLYTPVSRLTIYPSYTQPKSHAPLEITQLHVNKTFLVTNYI